MIVLIDSNVILDYMLKNEGYYRDAEDVLVIAESGKFEGYISASAVTDIFYVARKALADKDEAFRLIRGLLDIVYVAAVDDDVIRKAVDIHWRDFEDSVQYSAGKKINADYIVTRDANGFNEGVIPAIDPKSFVALLSGE